MPPTPATPWYNADVLDAIPLSARKVLEVGTGSGALAHAVCTRHPDIVYVGVEVSKELALIAAPFCKRFYIENFESASPQLGDELRDTDVVIFADVLEHFIDPWNALSAVRRLLRPTAELIACIPNTQHWSMQYRLMAGDLNYTDGGLLDRTHLRFFSRQTMLAMFERAGFTVTRLIPRIFDFPMQQEILEKISAVARMFGLDPHLAVQDAAPFQFIVVARVGVHTDGDA